MYVLYIEYIYTQFETHLETFFQLRVLFAPSRH